MSRTLCVAAFVAGLFISVGCMAAEPLGRLFFTPAQRGALDAGKQTRVKGPARVAQGPREVTLNGVVTRSDGESTVWLNGRPLDKRPASAISATVSRSDPAAARVKLDDTRSAVRMRVGQRLDGSTGKIAEPYQAARAETAPIAKREETAPPPAGANKSKALDYDAQEIGDNDRDAPSVAR
jgi:hypothetical protein